MITCGQITYAFSEDTNLDANLKSYQKGEEIIYQYEDPSLYELKEAYEKSSSIVSDSGYECKDIDALHTYLSELKLKRKLFGKRDFIDKEEVVYYSFDGKLRDIRIGISEDMLELDVKRANNPHTYYYEIEGKADLDYLSTLIPIYHSLHVFCEMSGGVFEGFEARLLSLILVENKKETILKEVKEAPFGRVGMFKKTLGKIQLAFSTDKVLDYYIEVETTDKEENYIITKKELDNNTFKANAKNAYYRVYVTYEGPYDSIYKAVYQFDIARN